MRETTPQQFRLFCVSYFPYLIFTVALNTSVCNILLNLQSDLSNTFKIEFETALKCFTILHIFTEKILLD